VGCSRFAVAGGLTAALVLATPAAAHVAHTVEPGETLWSIAAASNFTTRSLAAANGLSENTQVVAGSTVWVPSESEAATALTTGTPVGGTGGGSGATGVASAAGSAPRPQGAYTVRPGDTLSGIAASSGIRTDQLAWMNGLSPTAHVISGTVLKLPTGAPPARAQAATPPAPPAPSQVPEAPPYATPGRVSAAQIGQIASTHGVSPSLAAAVAWQESGFNNGVVSPANARGVMQVLPGTWDWIENSIVRRRLDPNSPTENVHAGVTYLNQLLRDAGGDPARAVASYYQGDASVRRIGMLPDTRRYVNNVLALRSRFGGP
jgi:soluble lytic murein transglycosylase-like protein